MDTLAPLLRAFYTGALSAGERSTIHSRLLQSLRDPACVTAAAEYISHLTTTADLEPDPFVLHYALHALEICARNAFTATPAETRARLLQLLIDFLVSAHARNLSLSSENVTEIPSHAVNKAASAAVQLGLREWVRDSTHAFPRVVLALIDQNGHTADSLPRILAGIALVTGLVDAAVESSRKDLPSANRGTLLRQLRSIADGIVAALEIGMRMSGPHFPPRFASAAVRAVGSLVRVEPGCVKESVAVLKRCVLGRSDLMGAEILGVLAELFGEGKVKMPEDWEATLGHVAGLLEAVAMGETVLGDDEDGSIYGIRLIAYGEAVSRRVIALGAPMDALQRIFNGFMGVTMRWAGDRPELFVSALDSWLNIVETLEDAEVEPNELLERVYAALSDLCVKRCMNASNGKVLGLLEEDEDEDSSCFARKGHNSDSRVVFQWDEAAEVMAAVASDPVNMSAVLFASSDGAGEDVMGPGEGDDLTSCRRASYIGKCVEALVVCARMSPDRVGGAVSEFVCNTFRVKGQKCVSVNEVAKADIADLCTAARIAYCIVPLFPPNSPRIQLMFQIVPELMKTAIEKREAKLGTLLLRTTASLTRTLIVTSSEFVQRVGSSLIPVIRRILSSANCPDMLASAAMLLLLFLDRFGRQMLFRSEPPIDASVIAETSYHSVAALGIAAMTRWALVPERDAKTSLPVKWTPEEWAMRESGFRSLCLSIFREFREASEAVGKKPKDWGTMLAIARGAGLLKTIVLSMHSVHGNATDVLWRSAVRGITQDCLTGLCGLKAQVDNAQSGLDEDARKVACGVMGCLVSAIESVLRICRRQVAAEAPGLGGKTIDTIVGFASAQNSARLARAALRLIREEIANGSGLAPGPGIELAARTVSQGGEPEVVVAGVGVLVEAVKQHWRDFWPRDVASVGGSPASVAGDAGAGVRGRGLYVTALHGVLGGVRSAELGPCRAGLLGLQSLDAARRLYSREAAFRGNGAAGAVVGECLRIAGAGGDAGRESLADEAVEVVWGVARVDLEGFYRTVLPGAVAEIGGVDGEQARRLVQGFDGVKDRPGFVRKVAAFVNDFVYLRGLNSGPSL